MRRRWKRLVAVPAALLVLLGIAHVDRAASLSPGDWRSASRDSVGLAPDPATTPEAIVQVYAARAVRWRGYFGVHTWVAAKPSNAAAYTVYEVTRWQQRRSGSMVAISDRVPDGRWYGNEPELVAELRGEGVDEVIARIDRAARDYPYADEYHVWPGPNSNTFTAFVLRAAPELRADLPPNAIGKDYLGSRLAAGAPSGTGFQLSLFGLVGFMAAVEEGVELNLLGMSFGVDPLDLAVKLPFAGRFGLVAVTPAAAAEPEDEPVNAVGNGSADASGSAGRRYTFSWPYSDASAMRPRGGTSRGPAVALATGPSAAWLALQESGITAYERDRRAILAMAGDYRTSFDFLETVGFTEGFEPGAPYQSWATETIDVIEDGGDRIVLQHVIVMQYVDEDGRIQGPVVQKHWRQDWVFEDDSLHVYAGNDKWTESVPAPADRAGRWSQAVYQVDDSPRYEALGQWVHRANYSAWTSDETWRPLPRRESSVRDDYQVLMGTNRHTITPAGWVQEEDNLKVAIDAEGRTTRVLAREVGVARYEAIVDFDFSARDRYWELTAPFWADVRAEWQRIYRERPAFTLREPPGEPPLFLPMFDFAAALETGQAYDRDSAQGFIRETIGNYLN